MADKSKISWTDTTWSPVTGCSRVSPGCLNCYSERLTAGRLSRQPRYTGLTDQEGHWTGEVRCHPELLDQPLHWKKPRRIFVCSMSDLFHSKVPWEFAAQVFDVMVQCPQHCFQILTKRPGRLAAFAEWWTDLRCVEWPDWIWVGTSVESQKYAPRLDCLARVPAKVRFVSVEPLLSPVELYPYFFKCSGCGAQPCTCKGLAINQVIVGGESGPNYRPMEIDWLKNIAAECDHVGARLFVKQDSGQFPGKQGRIPGALWARKEMP